MARIRFLRDFGGRSTDWKFYLAGEVVDLGTAEAVVAEGAAEYVTEVSEGEALPPALPSETLPDETPAPRKKRTSRREP